MNDNYLLHSDVYLGEDYTDGLKHWKYVKKYRNSKGKWVYVYNDPYKNPRYDRVTNHNPSGGKDYSFIKTKFGKTNDIYSNSSTSLTGYSYKVNGKEKDRVHYYTSTVNLGLIDRAYVQGEKYVSKLLNAINSLPIDKLLKK